MKNRTKFSLKEDETIINLTREGKDIDFIISQLPQRSRKQILSRLRHLSNIETKLQWSPHEDFLLLDNFYKFGPKYDYFENIATGRKRKEIRERLKILLKKSEEQMINEEEMFIFNKIEIILRQNEDFVNYRKRKLSYNENSNQKLQLIPDIYSLISSQGKGSVKDHITMDKISDVFFTMLKETDEFKDKSNRFKERIIKYNINVLFAHLAYHHKEILCSHINNIIRLFPEKADKELFLRELNECIGEIHKVYNFNVNQSEEFIGLNSTIPIRSNKDESATSQSQSPSFPENVSQSPSLPEIVSQPDSSQVDYAFSKLFRILDNQSNEQYNLDNDQWDSLAQSQF
ncbi:hypothetical protein M9Y10_035449 [Tritrichomonas musculus]|uniref:Myb-like domain-containing protein n=1 Tax=Tritrichomonas musculus TaxID=1915356 RepID=A0ABR2KHP4_9EUKA